MVIVGIVGLPCCGKEEFASHLKQNWGFTIQKLPFLSYKSALLHKETKEILFDSKETLSILSQSSCNNEAMELCKASLMNWKTNQVIYPIFSLEQVKFMRKRNYFHLIYLEAPTKQRFRNFCLKYFEISLETFVDLDDFLLTRTALHSCIQEANFRAQNHDSLLNFHIFLENQRTNIERPFRPSWDAYFMKVAYALKARSNCMKRSVGALIMKEKRIVSTGYNGTPAVLTNCYEEGCKRCNSNAKQGVNLHLCVCIHAEESAILEAKNADLKGATIYTTLFPCSFCAKIIVHSKICRVVYDEDFDDKNSRKILAQSGVEVCQLSVSLYLFNI